MTASLFLAIFCIGFTGSFIGAVTGGSGLIVIPGLIFCGFSPQAAIATDQLGLIAENLAAWRALHQAKKIDYRLALRLSILAGSGSAVGAYILIHMHSELVEKIIGFLVLAVGMVIFRNKKIGTSQSKLSGNKYATGIGYVLYFVVGLWGGALGAGFGLLARYVLLFSYRKTILEGAGVSKLTSIAIALCSLPIFLVKGFIVWSATGPLVLGMAAGSYFGTHYGLKLGDEKLRTLFLMMILISGLKLLIP